MLHMVCPNLKVIQINGNFFRRLALICSRTPHGVRGLKLYKASLTIYYYWSHSAWSALGLKYPPVYIAAPNHLRYTLRRAEAYIPPYCAILEYEIEGMVLTNCWNKIDTPFTRFSYVFKKSF